MRKILLLLAIVLVFASCRTNTVPHGCGKKSKKYYHGAFLEYRWVMTFEEAQGMYDMYCISPELTCQCDDFHTCQQCHEDDPEIWEDVTFFDH